MGNLKVGDWAVAVGFEGRDFKFKISSESVGGMFWYNNNLGILKTDCRPMTLQDVETEEQAKGFIGRKVVVNGYPIATITGCPVKSKPWFWDARSENNGHRGDSSHFKLVDDDEVIAEKIKKKLIKVGMTLVRNCEGCPEFGQCSDTKKSDVVTREPFVSAKTGLLLVGFAEYNCPLSNCSIPETDVSDKGKRTSDALPYTQNDCHCTVCRADLRCECHTIECKNRGPGDSFALFSPRH